MKKLLLVSLVLISFTFVVLFGINEVLNINKYKDNGTDIQKQYW